MPSVAQNTEEADFCTKMSGCCGREAVPTPCTLLRARVASCLAATGERPTMLPISSKRHRERIVLHERDPFGGIQSIEYHE